MPDTSIPDGLELTPYDEAFYKDPYPVYARLRDAEPVHKDRLSLWSESWTVTGYDAVRQLLTDARLSNNPRTVGLTRDPRADNPVTNQPPDLMSLDAPEHQRLRRTVAPFFTPSGLAPFEARVAELCRQTVSALTVDGTTELIAALADPLPTRLIAELIGVDATRHEDFKAWTRALQMQGHAQPTDAQWQAIVAADAAMREHVQEIIRARQSAPADDIVSHLLRTDEISEAEIVQMCCLLVGAGNFTTTDAISNLLLAWLNLSDVKRVEASEAPKAFVEEVLRHDSSVLAVRRYATENIEIGGKRIPKGAVVSLVLAAANHDPAVHVDPEALQPARARVQSLTFGRGVHHCLGAPLVRLQLTCVLTEFAAAFPHAQLVSVKRNRTMGFRGCTRLEVRLVGRLANKVT